MTSGHAASISLHLSEVRIVDLVRVLYAEILKKSYVLDGDTLKAEEVVSLNLRNVETSVVERQVVALLDAQGYTVNESAGVARIRKRSLDAVAKEVVIYRPRFRSVAYLQELLGGLFPVGSFSSQRQISQGSSLASQASPAAAGARGSSMASAPAPFVQETQGSALSLIDKGLQDTLVFQGESKDVEKLAGLLAQLDQPSAELVVKAVVYEVRTEQTEGSAITLAASILSGKLGISIDGGASQGNAVKLKFNSLEAVYSALSGDKRFKLVSSPTMRVKSGNSARFVAGSEVPVLGNVSYQNNGQAVQSVDYKSSGVILDLKPQVREDVTDLTIFQQISSFVPTTTGVNQSPTLLKRELQTQVSAKADEMIVLGGLEESQATESEQGLSFLPRFLRSSGDDRTRTEIMIVLHVQRI